VFLDSPRSGYRRDFCEAEPTLFASFSGKRRILLDEEACFAEVGWKKKNIVRGDFR
jgi:hypothetical protein